jgi:hypothetical protein
MKQIVKHFFLADILFWVGVDVILDLGKYGITGCRSRNSCRDLFKNLKILPLQ